LTSAAWAAYCRELAAVFLRLGLTAFGGPVAHIAMMEDEAVVRRQWLMRERFLDLLGVPNLLHGPRCGPLADGGVSGDGRRWGRGAPAAWQHLQALAPATTRYSMRSPMTFAMGLHAACADLDIFCLDDDSRPTR